MASGLYRLSLRLLPAELRREFGGDMVQLFQDRLAETNGRGRGRSTIMAQALMDVAWQAIQAWSRRIVEGTTTMTREVMNVDGWMRDLSFGLRTLRRRPGFSVAAVVTLALGIGATVAIFTVVDGVLLSPLPYPDSHALFEVRRVDAEGGRRGEIVDHPDVRTWQDGVDGIRIAGYAGARPTLTGLGRPEVLSGARVTDGLMGVLGVTPALGRDLRREDDVPDGPRVVVVSNRFWTERLGRDPDVLGRSVTLDGEPWEIVGVAPSGFDFPNAADLWLPRRHDPEGCGHGCRVLRAVGRLDPGTSLETAEARFASTSSALAQAFPDEHRYETHELRRLIDAEVADVRVGLWVLLGAVTMVLLIACANVANLMLARGESRRGEVALRASLGASRTRIVRQLLTESLLLSTLAGLLGFGLALWGTDVLLSMAPEALPRLDEVGVDATVMGFTALVVLLVTALFGLMPARELTSGSLSRGLGRGSRSSGGRQAGTFRSLLLVGEIALSLSLLVGAGLLLRTLGETRAVEMGFRTEGVERFRLTIPESRYDSLGVPRFFEELERELAALPEVESAGLGFGVPLSSGNINTSFQLLDRPEAPPAERESISLRPVTPGYLRAAGIPLVRGRWFENEDRRSVAPVAVINQAAVDRWFPDSEPLGTRIRIDSSWGFEEEPERTIVGVVGNVRRRSPTREPEPALYLPNAQFALNSLYATLHLGPGVESAMPGVRATLARLDPDLAITNVHRLDEVVDAELAPTRFYLGLLAIFSVLAVVLAAVGLYGVVSFLVGRRTREIGIRIALGATSEEVVTMVARESVRAAVGGMVLGVVVSLLGVRMLRSLLYGVSPYDPLTMTVVTAILSLVVAAATILPARRASRVAPATTLREE